VKPDNQKKAVQEHSSQALNGSTRSGNTSVSSNPARTLTLVELRKIPPPGGIPLSRGEAIDRMNLGGKVDRMREWRESMAQATGHSVDELNFLRYNLWIAEHMSLLYDVKQLRPDVESKMFNRLKSLQPANVQPWHDAFKEVLGERDLADDVVVLVILPVDRFFDSDRYVSNKAIPYLNRLRNLPGSVIGRWVNEVDQFKGTQLDAAMNIILLDAFFQGDRFDEVAFQTALSQRN
jgi:hypothetical protein